MAKMSLKKKITIIGFLITNVLPALLIGIVIITILQGAINLGSWITTGLTGSVSTDNTSWVDTIDSEVFESSLVNKTILKYILEAEEDSYKSKAQTFTLTYERDDYGIRTDENGNAVLNENGFPEYENRGKVEVETSYIYDISDKTYQFRLPWQLIYAISVITSVEDYGSTEEEYLDDFDESDIEERNQGSDDINVTKRTVNKVVNAFKSNYEFVYNYYDDGIHYYSYRKLKRLPHEGSSDYYIPQTVLKKVETCLNDYNFNSSASLDDANTYVNNGMTATARSDRFMSALKQVGCEESDIDLIIEILGQLGGCDDLIDEISNVFQLEGRQVTDGVIVDIGDTELTEMTQYALQFVGYPYVYGGTSLTNGIDCSAFVRAIYANYGVSLPRTSKEQVRCGVRVATLSDAQPGDLIFYATNGVVHHVVMYLGNNKIVHASNSKPYPAGGIKVTANAQYQTIYAIRRLVQQ